MIVDQDTLRRQILHVWDEPGGLSASYIDLTARFALDHGLDVELDETLRRHRAKLDATAGVAQALERVLHDVGWARP